MVWSSFRTPRQSRSQRAIGSIGWLSLLAVVLCGCLPVSTSPPPRAPSTPVDPLLQTRTRAAEAAAAADAARRRSEEAVKQAMP
jgi:hypothetical protein